MTDPRGQPDRLAEHLDRLMPPGGRPLAEHDADPLVDLALRLSQAPHPALSEDAIARIEARLDAQMAPAVDLPGGRALRLARAADAARWMMLTVSLILVLAVVLVPLTAASLPGDAFYPLKRLAEGIELGLAGDPLAEAQAHLRLAERRVGEAERLAAAGRFEPVLVSDALVELGAAAQIAQAAALTGADAEALVERTIAATAGLAAVIDTLAATGVLPMDQAAQLREVVSRAQDGGGLLLPLPPIPTLHPMLTATSTPAPSATPSLTPGATATDTSTPTFTPSSTATSTATSTPAPSKTATSTVTSTATLTVTPRPMVVVSPTPVPAQSNPGTAEEEIDCSNPPPDGAPAAGWRERCEGGPPPNEVVPGQQDNPAQPNNSNSSSNASSQGSAPGNSGNAPGQSGGNPGQGRGK